jgi:hypothetical protein
MSKSASWDPMASSSPSPSIGQSEYKKYPGRLQRQDSDVRRDQLEEDAEFEITITGPGSVSEKKTIKLFDNLFDKLDPTEKESPTKKSKFWEKHKLIFVGAPKFNVRTHNTLEDAVGKGVDLKNIEVHVKKIPIRKRLTAKLRKSLGMKIGGYSRRRISRR